MGVRPSSINKNSDLVFQVDGKDFLLAGIISENSNVIYDSLMFKSAVDQEVKLDSVRFHAWNNENLLKFQNYLNQQKLVFDNLEDDFSITGVMISIECILIFLSVSLTVVTLLLFYSNFISLIKECEKQTCITFYLGYSKKKTIRDLLFKLCVIGTMAFVLATIFASIVGLWINTFELLNFAGVNFNSLALINPLAVFIGYIVAMLLLLLLFYKPIKKTTLKMPNSFGGSL